MSPERVARFLIQDAAHPRSISFCAHEIGEALQTLRGTFQLAKAGDCLEPFERLMEGLQAASADPRLARNLHGFNDWVQRKLNDLVVEISGAFFGAAPPRSRPIRSMSRLSRRHGLAPVQTRKPV